LYRCVKRLLLIRSLLFRKNPSSYRRDQFNQARKGTCIQRVRRLWVFIESDYFLVFLRFGSNGFFKAIGFLVFHTEYVIKLRKILWHSKQFLLLFHFVQNNFKLHYEISLILIAQFLHDMLNTDKTPVALTDITIRPIEEKDNEALARIIRTTLEEFGANHPGTVYYDAATDTLYQLFSQTPGSVYYVAEYNNELVGGGGIFPSPGLPEGTCELVKMYLLKKVRGLGLGKLLIQKALDFAKEEKYKNVYIETMPELQQALKAYEKFGFEYINQPLGNTGHFGCDLWMLKKV